MQLDEQYTVIMDTCDQIIPQASFKRFSEDITNEYLQLISGLDTESRAVVTRVLRRLREYAQHGNGRFYITADELDEYRRLVGFHYDRILELSDGWFLYDGKYFLPRREITSTVFYYRNFVDCLDNPGRLQSRDIIDAGSFMGDSALVLSEYTEKTVYTFEPIDEYFRLTISTIMRNNISNVEAACFALAKSESRPLMKKAGDASRVLKEEEAVDGSECQAVAATTLDAFFAGKQVDIGLIKLDVEGMELEVLEGARSIILQHRPALILSMYHNYEQFFGLKRFVEGLGLGYRFKIRKPKDLAIAIDTMLICENDSHPAA